MGKRLVIRAHSGVCDQIKFLAKGLLAEKSGVEVVFDTSWYETNGKDTAGRFVRAWEIPEAFPGLRIDASPSVALGPEDELFCGIASQEPVLRLRHELGTAFCPKLAPDAAALLDDLEAGHVCAVHVRRGDLATVNEHYGHPVGVDYLERACRIALSTDASLSFLFFSDEPDYVGERLIPALSMRERCRVVSLNGSERGHVDLFLISRAEVIVGSQGSFGSMAALLSGKEPVFITPRRSEADFRNIPNLIYLNMDRTFEYADVPNVDFSRLERMRKRGLWKLPYKLYRHLGKCLERQ